MQLSKLWTDLSIYTDLFEELYDAHLESSSTVEQWGGKVEKMVNDACCRSQAVTHHIPLPQTKPLPKSYRGR